MAGGKKLAVPWMTGLVYKESKLGAAEEHLLCDTWVQKFGRKQPTGDKSRKPRRKGKRAPQGQGSVKIPELALDEENSLAGEKK